MEPEAMKRLMNREEQMNAAEALVERNPTLRLHRDAGLLLHETRHGIARLDGDDGWLATREGRYLRAFGRVRRFSSPDDACRALGFSLSPEKA